MFKIVVNSNYKMKYSWVQTFYNNKTFLYSFIKVFSNIQLSLCFEKLNGYLNTGCQ